MNRIPHAIALMAFLFSLPAQAVNLLEVIELAIENDPRLHLAKARQQEVAARDGESLAELMPKLEVNAHYGKVSQILYGAQGAAAEDLNQRNLYEDKTAEFVVRQPILDLAALAGRRVDEGKLTRAKIEYRIEQQELLLRTTEYYFEILMREDDLNFARAERTAISKQLEQTKQRFKLGLTAVTDVHEAQARHDLAAAQEILAENELAITREKMRDITGEYFTSLRKLKPDTPLIPPSPTSITDWTEAALSQNLELARLQQEETIAARQIGQVRAERWPTLSLSGSMGRYSYGGPFHSSTQDSAVTLDFAWQMYDGGAISSRISQAEHRKEATRIERVAAERETIRNTRNAFLGVLAGMSHVKALNQALISAEGALKATETGFEVGTRSALEVLDAQRELFRAQRDYAHTRYDYILNTLKLKKAVGLLTIDDIVLVNNWLQ